MSVVNTETKFLRPQYTDLRDWINDKRNVYIGRKHAVFVSVPNSSKKERFPEHSSVFANPYRVSDGLTECDVMKLYEAHIRLKLQVYPDLIHDLLSLKGKNLGCIRPKHAGVLLKLIDEHDRGVLVSLCSVTSRCS